MVAVKRNSKPVSTITNKTLYIDTNEIPQKCRRLSELPSRKHGETLTSNGALWQKLPHINAEQNRATSALPRNLLFLNSTPLQRTIIEQSLCRHRNKFKLKKFIALFVARFFLSERDAHCGFDFTTRGNLLFLFFVPAF